MKLDVGMHPHGANDIQPTYDSVTEGYIWKHYWMCKLCWTRVERIVRIGG